MAIFMRPSTKAHVVETALKNIGTEVFLFEPDQIGTNEFVSYAYVDSNKNTWDTLGVVLEWDPNNAIEDNPHPEILWAHDRPLQAKLEGVYRIEHGQWGLPKRICIPTENELCDIFDSFAHADDRYTTNPSCRAIRSRHAMLNHDFGQLIRDLSHARP